MANQTLTVWQQITVEFNGHSLTGSYAVENGIVKVKTPFGEKADPQAKLRESNAKRIGKLGRRVNSWIQLKLLMDKCRHRICVFRNRSPQLIIG
jgi:hypothetical protein